MDSTSKPPEIPSKIRITRILNRGYIFHADDYVRMRSQHRIVGTLVGCAPACPRNPNVNGLPAILSDCELRLLCAERLTDVRPSADWTTSPTDAEQLAYVAFCDRSLDEQRAHQHAVKLSESRKQIERILEGKRQKMRATGASEEAVAALSADEVLAQIGEQSVFNADNALRQVPTTGHRFDQSDTPAPGSGDCIATEDLPYRVFRDLWQRGKYVTAGDTFGGTFLIYPGDPAVYHASHIVHCVPDGRIPAEQLVAGGRLAVLVNKLCVFAYETIGDDGCRRVAYQTIEWEGREADLAVEAACP